MSVKNCSQRIVEPENNLPATCERNVLLNPGTTYLQHVNVFVTRSRSDVLLIPLTYPRMYP